MDPKEVSETLNPVVWMGGHSPGSPTPDARGAWPGCGHALWTQTLLVSMVTHRHTLLPKKKKKIGSYPELFKFKFLLVQLPFFPSSVFTSLLRTA